jgi:hypothetical protein
VIYLAEFIVFGVCCFVFQLSNGFRVHRIQRFISTEHNGIQQAAADIIFKKPLNQNRLRKEDSEYLVCPYRKTVPQNSTNPVCGALIVLQQQTYSTSMV